MANEFSGLFDSTNGVERTYTASELATVFRAFGGTGVASLDAGLKVSAQGNTMSTLVAPGLAMIKGYVYELQDDGGAIYACTHEISASSDRIDRVVLKLDLDPDVCNVTLKVKTGTPGASPVAPSLTRSAGVYEISLAQVRIGAGAQSIAESDITDERGDESLCGALLPDALRLSTLYGRLSVPVATITESGLMSASDKQKMEGLSALATGIERTDGTSVEAYEDDLSDRIITAQTTADSKATININRTAVCLSNHWSEGLPCWQDVTIAGITATMNPFFDFYYNEGQQPPKCMEAFACVTRVITSDGSIRVICDKQRPPSESGFYFQLKNIQ